MADERPRVRIEPNPKWIRGTLQGRTVVDSTTVQLVWEVPYYPAWYIPVDDLDAQLEPNGRSFRSPSRGDGTRYDVVVGGNVIADAAWRHLDSPVRELRDLVRIEWSALDTWFEEDSEVYVHPRSPDVRVDILPSSRRITVTLDGVVLAESARAHLLFETGLPTRYYIPKVDVRMDLLTPTETETACPYKGWANYWSVDVDGSIHEDLAWAYRTPLPESKDVAGLVCFYNEKVDLDIDGVRVDRPRTKFS